MKTSTLATILVAVLLLSNTMAASQTRPNTARPVAEKKLATPDFVPKALPEATVNGLRRWGLTESEWLDPSTIKFPSKANAAYFANDERYKELFVSAETGLDPVASVIVFLNWRPTVMNASTTIVASPLSNNGRAAQAYDRTVGVTNAVDVPAAELEVAANPGRYDPKKYQLLETAAAVGDPAAMYEFATRLVGNSDANIDHEGVSLMQKAAEHGATNAMTWYAEILYSKQNSTVARAWAKRAAERGDPIAMKMLASDLESGRNGPPNLVAATSWLKRAAETGDAAAMLEFGTRLEFGEGIAKNERAAVVWYRRAAEAQYPSGMVTLGIALSQGIGIEQNQAAAVGWFRRAAEQEDLYAMVLLGTSLRYGIGVDKNESAAAGWYLRAARADQPLAMIELAEMLEIGIDRRPPEPQAAKYWYDKALENSESLDAETKAQASDASVALEGRGIRAFTPLEMLSANGVRPRSECNAIPKKLRNFNIERAYPATSD
jgi:TPR repeat protein